MYFFLNTRPIQIISSSQYISFFIAVARAVNSATAFRDDISFLIGSMCLQLFACLLNVFSSLL